MPAAMVRSHTCAAAISKPPARRGGCSLHTTVYTATSAALLVRPTSATGARSADVKECQRQTVAAGAGAKVQETRQCDWVKLHPVAILKGPGSPENPSRDVAHTTRSARRHNALHVRRVLGKNCRGLRASLS
jgi:hypothetical protein